MLKVVNENILCSCYSMRREAAFLGFVTLHGPYTNWCSVEETVGIIPAMSMTNARQTDRESPSLYVIFQQNSLIKIWKYRFPLIILTKFGGKVGLCIYYKYISSVCHFAVRPV